MYNQIESDGFLLTAESLFSSRYRVRRGGTEFGWIDRTPGTFGKRFWFTPDGRGWDTLTEALRSLTHPNRPRT